MFEIKVWVKENAQEFKSGKAVIRCDSAYGTNISI